MRRKNALCKEFFMEIKKTYNRFLSICLIAALGTAFFAGVRATNPDMQQSADSFFDESKLMDIRVLSTLGLTDDDVNAIRAIDGVEEVMPAYSQDLLTIFGENQLVLKLMTVPDKINLITVDEGRLPENDSECLVDNILIDYHGYEIGDTITLMSGNDTDIEDIVTNTEVTITGRGRIASYLNLTRDSSQIGDGSVTGFVMLTPEGFSMKAYTELAVTVKDAAELDCYGDEYEEKIECIVDKIESIADAQCQLRYDNVIAEAMDSINEAKQEVADGEQKLADAAAEIEDGERKLADARAEVADGEKKLADAIDEVNDGYKQLADARKQLFDGEKEISDAKVQLRDGEAELEDARVQLADGEAQLADAIAKAEDGEAQLNAAKEELLQSENKLNSAKATIEENEALIAENEAQLAAGEREIEEGRVQLAEGWQQYEQGLWSVNENITALDQKAQEFEENVKLVEDGFAALEEARPAVEMAKRGLEQLAELESALNASENELVIIKKKIADLLQNPEENQEEIANVQMEAAILEAKINELSMQAALLGSQLEGAEAKVAEFDASLAQLNWAKEQLGDIDAARQEIADGYSELEAAKAVLEQSRLQLESSQKEIEVGEAEIISGRAQLEAGKKQLADARAEVRDGEARINEGWQEIADNEEKIVAGWKEIEDNLALLEDARREIKDGEAELEDARKKIVDGEAELEDARKQIADNEVLLSDAVNEITENEIKINDAKKEIQDGEKELADGRKEYEDALAKNFPDIEKAKVDIAQAETDITEIKVPEWYVLDRNYIQTCVEYAQDAERIGNIGNVFPVIFFLVAALVSLTTMTRMVEEERTQIGTLKALGYSKVSIAAKYVLYAFFATMIGGVFGTLIGQKILPMIIMRAYSIMYITMTEYVTPLHTGYTVTSLVAAAASTTIAVIAACYKELMSVPAQLMRPEAPKIGKRVWLEHITFVWNRINFSNKATVRNLFRYKKRFFMTIIGIGGCMGLLMVGFGLKDSIMTIGDRQYEVIRIYHSTITLAEDTDAAQKDAVYHTVLDEENTAAAMMASESTVAVSSDAAGKGERSSYLFVPSELDKMDEFIVLQNRMNHERYHLTEEGAVISEKLATLLDVSDGDEIYIEVAPMQRVPVKISHIAENYYFHYVYLTPALYEQIYGEPAEYQEIFVKFNDSNEDYERIFSEKYLQFDSVSGVSYTRNVSERIADMIHSMDAVIYVIIVAAGLLAFVVLYNLNNINISERKRELATLKVLGFFDGEVSGYVFRENIWLTLFGAIAGIFFGIALHRFVIITAEVDMIMFGRNIYLRSYIYSILLTFAFSAIVNVVMHRKLKKIDMIESLKSVE